MRKTSLLLLLGWLLFAVACAKNNAIILPPALPEPPRSSVETALPEQNEKTVPETRVDRLETLKPEPATRVEVDASGLTLPDNPLAINVDGLPLNEFIHLALGDVLGLSYTVGKSVASRKDPVSLHVAKPVAAAHLLDIVKTTLELYDIALISTDMGTLKVDASNSLRTAVPSLPQAATMVRLGRVIEFMPLRYAEPREVISFARHFLRLGTIGDAVVIDRLNGIMVVDEPHRIARFRQVVEMVDRPPMVGRHLRLIRPAYWQVERFREVLVAALGLQGIPVADEETAGNRALWILPVAEVNSLIVAAPEKKWLQALLALIAKLDRAEEVKSGSSHFIYFVRNARAEELGQVISNVLSGSDPYSSAQSGALNAGLGASPNRRSVDASNDAGNDEGAASTVTKAGNLTVITDPVRNALIFVGEATEYQSVMGLLDTLDRRPRQVLMEATVAEITLDDDTKYGVEWSARGSGLGVGDEGTISTLDGLGLEAGGLNYIISDVDGGRVKARLNALQKEDRVKILSSPRLLALDNKAARIQVGDEIQVATQEITDTSSGSGDNLNVLRTFKSVQTGVILEITPTINEGGVVQLQLYQEVSEPRSLTSLTPAILKRTVDTTLVAKTGETVLIGGLIRNNENNSQSKVPIVGDIPLLGNLFASTSRRVTTTETIILITPHIVEGEQDHKFLTKAFQDMINASVE